jgi:hypothetical protein
MTKGATVKAFKLSTSDSLHIPIVVVLDDFNNMPNKSELKELQAVLSATKVEGVRTVHWEVIDLYSAVYTLKTKAYFVLSAHT